MHNFKHVAIKEVETFSPVNKPSLTHNLTIIKHRSIGILYELAGPEDDTILTKIPDRASRLRDKNEETFFKKIPEKDFRKFNFLQTAADCQASVQKTLPRSINLRV